MGDDRKLVKTKVELLTDEPKNNTEKQMEELSQAEATMQNPRASSSNMITNIATTKESCSEFALDNIVKTVVTSPPVKRKYKCKICSSEFLKEQELAKHNRKH